MEGRRIGGGGEGEEEGSLGITIFCVPSANVSIVVHLHLLLLPYVPLLFGRRDSI